MTTRSPETLRRFGAAAGIAALAEQLTRDLLQTCHLYQHRNIDIADLDKCLRCFDNRRIPPQTANSFRATMRRARWRFRLPDSCGFSNDDMSTINVNLPTVRLFCQNCNEFQAYNPFSSAPNEFPSPVTFTYGPSTSCTETVQQFALGYQCQMCKPTPETFLVRREGLRLILCGRSPMEHVAVSPVIPKNHAKYVRDATLASNCKQTLAGLFLLRVFIEQYVRGLAGPDAQAEQNLDSYSDALPDDFKSRFPSLNKLYSDLSAAIHSANASEVLFSDTLRDIEEHFDAKRLYKMSEEQPKQGTDCAPSKTAHGLAARPPADE